MGIYVTGYTSTLRDTPLRYGMGIYVTGFSCEGALVHPPIVQGNGATPLSRECRDQSIVIKMLLAINEA